MAPPATSHPHQPPATPSPRLQAHAGPERNDAPLVGAWVQVRRGVAARAYGYVRDCRNGRATLLATVLAGRPVLLTVDAADCAPADRRAL